MSYVTPLVGFVINYPTITLLTREAEPMLNQCWPIVYDAGPTLATAELLVIIFRHLKLVFLTQFPASNDEK